MRFPLRRSFFFAFACFFLSIVPRAFAQAPMNGESATQPSPGQLLLRPMFHYYRLEVNGPSRFDRGKIEEFDAVTSLDVGLRHDVALSLRVPIELRRQSFSEGAGTDEQEGVGDLTLLAKWRIWRRDTNALDTARLSLLGGISIRSGDDPFTSDAYSPLLGLAYTQIYGRHGFNGSMMWKFTTGGNEFPVFAGESTADAFSYDFAYLYRLAPEEYSAETLGAWYAVAQIDGRYETNGDNEVLASPGIMYEATTWAIEFSVQFPILERLDHRPETEYVLQSGLRFSF